MKAAVLEKLNAPLVVDDLTIPSLGTGQVLVHVRASGICGAQIGEISGAKGKDKYLPHLLGHEGGGIVLDVGPGVTQVKPDDHVVMHWRKGAGIEATCPKYTRCDSGEVVGGGWVTTFNEFSVVSENRLTKIDDYIPFDVAALMGCAVTTGLGIINNEAQLKIGQTIAVAGCGGVGLNVIQGACLAGAWKIIAIDNIKIKLDMALNIGATHTINPLNSDGLKNIENVDVFVDCTGDVNIIDKGYSLAKKTILVGQPKHYQDLILSRMRKNYCGKVLMDSQGGMTNPNRDIPRYLNLYRTGELELDSLITHRFPLEEVNKALDLVRSGQAGRVILEMAK